MYIFPCKSKVKEEIKNSKIEKVNEIIEKNEFT